MKRRCGNISAVDRLSGKYADASFDAIICNLRYSNRRYNSKMFHVFAEVICWYVEIL